MIKRSHSLIFLTLGVLLFVVYLALSDPFTALREIGKIDIGLFIIAVLANNIGLLLFAFSWYIILRGMGVRLRVKEAVQASFISFFVVWLIPIPVGSEIIRAYLVRNKEDSGVGKAAASVIIHKSMYNISFGILIAVAAALSATVYGGVIPISRELLLFVLVFSVGSSVLFAAILSGRFLRWLSRRLPEWLRSRISSRLAGPRLGLDGFGVVADDIASAVVALRSKMLLNLAAFLMVAFHWSSGSIATYFIALSLGKAINIWEIVLVYAVVEFIQQLNIVIPGGIGIVDAGLTGAFVLIGIPLSLAAAISLLTRLVTYWLELVVSFVVSVHYGYRELLRDFLA